MSQIVNQAQGGLPRANELVSHYGQTLGVKNAVLDTNLDRSFGESGLRYVPERDVLLARVSLGLAFRASSNEKSKSNVRKVVAAINDPEQLQHTFELAGSRIELNEANQTLYLVREIPVKGTTGSLLTRQMNELLNLGAKWQLRWLAWAGAIVHGHAKPPGEPLPVTRENDHLHKEFSR